MTNFYKNKKILITGGSRGLGLALAQHLSLEGANVAVVARNSERLATLEREFSISTIQGDIADKNSIHRIYGEAIATLGRIDILINNASSLGPTPLRLLIDTDCEDFTQAIETNLLGAFRLIKLVLPSMILRNEGIILNISSDAAVQNYPNWGAYSVSKSALNHLTQIFSAELIETEIKFLAVDPGDMNTELHLKAVPDADLTKLRSPGDSAQLLVNLLTKEHLTSKHIKLNRETL